MKRLVGLVLVSLVLQGVFAQNQQNQGGSVVNRRPNLVVSPFYVKNVFLNRITSTARGYRLEYFNAKMEPKAIYVPIEWFSRYNDYGRLADGGVKAEILFATDASMPYVSIFWRDGKFSHLRIFAQESFLHPSWGVLRPETNIDSRFKPDVDPEFEF